MEACRILGISVAGAALGVAVSLIVGMALLETAFSLPFAVILGIVLFVLGVLLLVNMSLSVAKNNKSKAKKSGGISSPAEDDEVARCTSLTLEITVLTIIAILTISGGAFAIWLYLKAMSVPSGWRTTMYIVLGASTTVILSVNLLDLIELCLRWCHSCRQARKEKAERDKQVKGFGPLKLNSSQSASSASGAPGAGSTTTTTTNNEIAGGQRRLFPLRAQNWLIIFVALFSGLYYGYCYGSIAAKQLENVVPGAQFNPIPIVIQYLEFSVPVGAVGGFVVVAIALMLPHLLSAFPPGTTFASLTSYGAKSPAKSVNNNSSSGSGKDVSSRNPILASATGKNAAGDVEAAEPQATDALLPKNSGATPTGSSTASSGAAADNAPNIERPINPQTNQPYTAPTLLRRATNNNTNGSR